MSQASRIEIEARFFILTCLGEMKQSGHLAHAAAHQTGLLADLLHLYPLERWHEQGHISEDQVTAWSEQALALLLPADDHGIS